MQEFISGCRVTAGTVKFRLDRETCTDGSASFAGTRFASASGAAIQLLPEGGFVALARACRRDGPQSAVAGEMLGMELLGMGLARGEPEGEPHAKGSINNGVDCSSVISAFRANRAGRPAKKFPFEGVFRGAGQQCVGSLFKIAAHTWEEDARREGWHSSWVGNDVADTYAKLARPALDRDPAPWLRERRARHRLLCELLGSLGSGLWKAMRGSRPAVGRSHAVADPAAGPAHVPVFGGGIWHCGVCGVAARSYTAAAAGQCPGQLVAATAAHESHALHWATFGEAGGATPLVLCAACGAHGSHKAINLCRPCPARGAGQGTAEAARYRKQASAVARRMHPSRPRTALSELRPLKLQKLIAGGGGPGPSNAVSGETAAAGEPAAGASSGLLSAAGAATASGSREEHAIGDATCEFEAHRFQPEYLGLQEPWKRFFEDGR